MCHIETKLCLSPNPSRNFHLSRKLIPCHKGLLFHKTDLDFRLASVAQCAHHSRKGKPIHQNPWTYGSENRIGRPTVSGCGWAYGKCVMVTPCKLCPVLESHSEQEIKDRMEKEKLEGWQWHSWVGWEEIMQDGYLSRDDKKKIDGAIQEAERERMKAIRVWKKGELARQRVKERDFAEGEGVVRK